MKYLVCITFILAITRTAYTDYTLEDQNQQQIDPVYQPQPEDGSAKDQDKRTIFPSSVNNFGWAKHVAVKPTGLKYVLGYGPVDLKYVPVVRPIAIKPTYQFRPIKSKWQSRPIVLRPLLPAVQKPQSQGKWKPIYKPPSLPPNVPAPPQTPSKPWQQQGWNQDVLQVPVKPAVQFKPTHSVVNLQPAPVVPVKPVVPVAPVQPLVPVQPVVPITPLRPVIPAPPQPVFPVTPLRPVVPVPAPVPAFPPAPLFHVTRPNLPVLPLGSSFPSPILNLPPPSVGFRPNFVGFPVATPNVAVTQALPKPSVVEFHGNPQIFTPQPAPPSVPVAFPFAPQPPFIPSLQLPSGPAQYPATAFQHPLPRDNPNVAVQQHDAQAPVVPQSHQHLQQANLQQSYYQQFGLEDAVSQNQEQQYQQQQLQQQLQEQQLQEQQLQQQQLQQQQLQEQQLQLQQQNYHQASQTEYLPPMGGFRYPSSPGNEQQQFEQLQQGQQDQFIQPGQTDVQIPFHLPSHPHLRPQGFGAFQSNDFQTQNQNIFNPSVSLEPPFTKRRIDKEVTKENKEENKGEVEESLNKKNRHR